jgi:hypothetical protein
MTAEGIISIALGIVGLAFTWRSTYKMYYPNDPCRIEFISGFYMNLFRSAVHNLPTIEIFYKQEKIKTNLVLINGYFLNMGTKDITRTMIVERLSIVLPNEFKWLEAKIVDASYEGNKKAPDISHTEEFSKLIFNIELLRHDTYINFEALVESPAEQPSSYEEASSTVARAMTFEHEIADTHKVVSEYPFRIPYGLYNANTSKEPFYFICFCAFAAWIVAIINIYSYSIKSPNIEMFIALDNRKKIAIDYERLPEDKFQVIGKYTNYNEILPKEEFYERLKFVRKHDLVIIDSEIVAIVFFIVIASAITILANSIMIKLRRVDRMRKILPKTFTELRLRWI